MKDSAPIRLYDPSFQSQHSAKCDVLIRAGHQRLQFAIVDQLQDQLRVLYDRAAGNDPAHEIPALFEEEPFLKFHFRKVKIAVAPREFIFIPSEVYNDQLVAAYSSFMRPGTETRISQLKGAQIKNITAFDPDLSTLLAHVSPPPLLANTAEAAAEAFQKAHFKPIGPQLLLQFNTGKFEVLLVDGKKIRFYNSFDNHSPDELNYFLLLIIEQLKLEATSFPVVVSGEIAEGDENFERLVKYFPAISFADSRKLVHISSVFSEIPPHRYFCLLGTNSCE